MYVIFKNTCESPHREAYLEMCQTSVVEFFEKEVLMFSRGKKNET